METQSQTPSIKAQDNFGKVAGVQTALLAVFLGIFTIYAHRAHTDTLLFSNHASKSAAQYQAKRIRASQLEMNASLISLIAPNSTEVVKTLADNKETLDNYAKKMEVIKAEIERKEKASAAAFHKAGLFDLAASLITIAVVLSALYFISLKKYFPMLGLLAGAIGVIIGLLGLIKF